MSAARSVEAAVERHKLHVYHDLAKTVRKLWWKKGRKDGGRKPRVGLAISGGVDSMALASVCREVTNKQSSLLKPLLNFSNNKVPKAIFTAFIVDHKLRPNSGHEAKQVSLELSKLGIRSKIIRLDWKNYGDPASLSNVESVARMLRYQALGRACRQCKIRTLFLAHHRDDQAETVLMRIVSNYAGDGLQGINAEAAIPECAGIYGVHHSGLTIEDVQYGFPHPQTTDVGMKIESGGVDIVRPLLDLDKEQLISICRQHHVRWFEDKTNADPTITVRNAVRSLLGTDVLPAALRKPRLLAMAAHKGAIIKVMDMWTAKALSRCKIRLAAGIGEVTITVGPKPNVRHVGRSVRLAKLVRKMIELVTPAASVKLQDLDQVVDLVITPEALYDKIKEDDSKQTSVNVAGTQILCEIIRSQQRAESRCLTIHRSSPTSREQQVTRIKPRTKTWHLWDRRYWILLKPPDELTTPPPEIFVRFLRTGDISRLRDDLDKEEVKRLEGHLKLAPGNTRFTCPAIVMNTGVHGFTMQEEVVALPSLGWSSRGWKRDDGHSSLQDWLWDIRYKYVKLPKQGTTVVDGTAAVEEIEIK